MATDLKAFKNLKLSPGEGVKAVLCSQSAASLTGLFGVFELEDGSFVACWENHHQKAQTLDDLKGFLNQHEKGILQFGIKE